jgi:uncharacterized protein YxjI
MHSVLARNVFLVKEHVGLFKAANNYDIFDPETGQLVMECREDNLGLITKALRFTDYKRNTPFDIQVRAPGGEQVVRITRGIAIFLSKVDVHDEADRVVGGFKQKFFSIGGAFEVCDAADRVLCSLKGTWTGWDFRFSQEGRELGHVTKKWSGIGKELFTSADNYVLEISPTVAADDPVRELILAAVLCIDMVLKE